MSMSTSSVAVLIGVGIVVLLLLAYVLIVIPRGELGEKAAWATLQSTELHYRSAPGSQEPMVLFHPLASRYVVLGLPTHDTRYPRVWIILNETGPISLVYILPRDQKYLISCSYLTELASRTHIDPQVFNVLKTNCTP